jgi:replication initiation protein RepC
MSGRNAWEFQTTWQSRNSHKSDLRSSEITDFAKWLIHAEFRAFSCGVRAQPHGETMTFASLPTNHAAGARRMNLSMLVARDRADSFQGLPPGTAKPFRILAAFQEAEPYLGLPRHAFKLISWLIGKTQAKDWESGSRPIAWPSAREQEEFLALGPSQVKELNRALFEGGIFVIRDHETGKRFGRRDKISGRIIEAFGFDLSPLAQRYDEFVRIAAVAKIERDRMKALRRRRTAARRAIYQAGDALTALGCLPDWWPRLTSDVTSLLQSIRIVKRSDEMALLIHALERRKDEAEQALRDASKSVNNNPAEPENRPHYTTTNLTMNLKDTVMATEESGVVAPEPEPTRPQTEASIEQGLHISPPQLVELAPRLKRYVRDGRLDWPKIHDAAAWLAGELGVSPPLWNEACRVMGRDYAAIALAVVSTKDAAHFSSSAGGYFAGMMRKAERGELRLGGTIWKLREEKWGKRRAAPKGWLN